MHILLANKAPIPVFAYGGTERVVWDLGKMLVQMGHRVTYLVPAGSSCDFAHVMAIDPGKGWHEQIPADVDIAHFQFDPEFAADTQPDCPYVVTEHGNARAGWPLPRNTVFVSRDHAARYGSTSYVHNGLDWAAYGPVDWTQPRSHHHFLGKAAWRVKNVKGAIQVARRAGVELAVMGGTRLNLRRGFRFTLSRHVQFYGMVGGAQKTQLLNASNGLIFPVRWHEPFGLAVIESLYFGCPVFATPYGALPELVPADCGRLSVQADDLVEAVRTHSFDRQACHARAVDHFSAARMAQDYLQKYQQVLDGEFLNPVQPAIQGEARQLPWTA